MTTENVRALLDDIRTSATQFAAQPNTATAVLLVAKLGQYTSLLIADRAGNRLVREAKTISGLLIESREAEVPKDGPMEQWWALMLPDGSQDLIHLPRPVLAWDYVVEIFSQEAFGLQKDLSPLHPLLGSYVLFVSSLVCGPVEEDAEDRMSLLAGGLVEIATEGRSGMADGFIDAIVQGADNLFWEWRRGCDNFAGQAVSEVSRESPSSVDTETAAAVPGEEPWYYDRPEDIPSGSPSGYYTDQCLSGKKRHLGAVFNKDGEPDDDVVEARARAGTIAVIRYSPHSWGMYFRSPKLYKDAAEIYEQLKPKRSK